MAVKQGPLTRDDLLEVWRGALDPEYRDPYETAGDGAGMEIHTQMLVQFERASLAIDRTTQSMFIFPWSGQTNAPASGAAKSTVTLTIERTKELHRSLVLDENFVVEEETTDASPDGPVVVMTGRRYRLLERLVFHPGETGPFTVLAEAERSGLGYDNPLPGTIKRPVQPGSGFYNEGADIITVGPAAVSLASPSASVKLVAKNVPDMPIPDHVGQYVMLIGGSNLGAVARARTFFSPAPPLDGSALELVLDQSAEGTTFSVGQFAADELVEFKNGVTVVAYGLVVGARNTAGVRRLTYVLLSGTPVSFILGTTIATGLLSGATLTLNLSYSQLFTAETNTAEWVVLDFVASFGLTVTNVLSPAGGRAPMLDAIGAERNINRSPGEDDETYRPRVGNPADVVSPNAIKRALVRALGDIPWCYREVGSEMLPGFFFDGDLEPVSITPHGAAEDAFDSDVMLFPGTLTSGAFMEQERVVILDSASNFLGEGYVGRIAGGVLTLIRIGLNTPKYQAGMTVVGVRTASIWTPSSRSVPASVSKRRFRYYLDYEQFRAFFLVGVPPLGLGEFGFAYDAGDYDAFDVPLGQGNFYDGYPYQNALVYGRVKDAVENAKAGGVAWAMYVERDGCTP